MVVVGFVKGFPLFGHGVDGAAVGHYDCVYKGFWRLKPSVSGTLGLDIFANKKNTDWTDDTDSLRLNPYHPSNPCSILLKTL